MKLLVNKLPINDIPDFNSDYEIKSEFIGSEEATAKDLINMMFDAMLLEGYTPLTIINSMIEVAYDKASWFNFDIDEVIKTTLETESDEQDE